MREKEGQHQANDRRLAVGGSRLFRPLALTQGIYYLLTGIWPLVHMHSFEAVTGPKADDWLVKTVGILVGVIGGVLCLAGWRDRGNGPKQSVTSLTDVPSPTPEIMALAVGSAAGLAAVDIVYPLKGRISPIYLLDALAEVILIAAWLKGAASYK